MIYEYATTKWLELTILGIKTRLKQIMDLFPFRKCATRLETLLNKETSFEGTSMSVAQKSNENNKES